jgi:hypothetical protein
MKHRCIWDVEDGIVRRRGEKCGGKVTYWIVGGCIEGHLMDLPLCTEHTRTFCDMFAKKHIGCRMCPRECEEYEIVVAAKVTL